MVEQVDEYVDIGDEMLAATYQSMEIEKDTEGQGDEEKRTGRWRKEERWWFYRIPPLLFSYLCIRIEASLSGAGRVERVSHGLVSTSRELHGQLLQAK
jgi:hypothetical protein